MCAREASPQAGVSDEMWYMVILSSQNLTVMLLVNIRSKDRKRKSKSPRRRSMERPHKDSERPRERERERERERDRDRDTRITTKYRWDKGLAHQSDSSHAHATYPFLK